MNALRIFFAMTVLTMMVSLGGAFTLLQEQQAREEDQIRAAIFACERVNILRGQVRELSLEGQVMDRRILDFFFSRGFSEEQVLALNNALDPIFDDFEQTVRDVRDTDCKAVVPGAENLDG